MKKYIVSVVSVLVFATSCKNDPKTATPPALEESADLNTTKETLDVKFASKSLDQMFEDYLNVKAALVNTNSSKTQNEAKKLAEHIGDNAELNKVRQVAVLMSNEKDIKKQREFFVGLNEEVLAAVQGNISSGKIVQQMCPMAFEGKGGVWLSNSMEVRNPYYGDEMLVCGYVKEEFGPGAAQ